jgi:phosphate transport system permease protein
MTEGGIGPAIFGTIAVTFIMILNCSTSGCQFQLFTLMNMQPDQSLQGLIRTSVNNLAGVPSIVFGLFGLRLLYPICRKGN